MTPILRNSPAILALAGIMALAAGASARASRAAVDTFITPPPTSIVRAELTSQELAQPLSAAIVLNLRNRDELETRVRRGERISPSEMASRYYPTHEAWSAIAGWASAYGLSVEPEDITHMSVVARGSVAQLADAFRTRFARVRGDDGRQYTSAVVAPRISPGIEERVAGVLRLQPQFRAHAATVYNPVGEGGYGPQYLLDQYGATGVGDGTGQVVAIFGFDKPPNPADLTNYWAKIGSPHTMADVTVVNPNNYPAFDDQFTSIDASPGAEVTLDIETVSGLCPGAKIRVYCLGDYASTAQAVLADLGQFPQMHQLLIGSAEPEATAPTATSQYFLALAAQGVTTFAPSGDGGSNPSPATAYVTYNPDSALTVAYPASDPYVTAVGGTYQVFSGVDPNSTNSSITGVSVELAWANGTDPAWDDNGSVYNGGGSGGGLSAVFTRPYWQGGLGLPGGTMRCVPDVSAAAAGNGGLYTYIGSDGWAKGTSESASIWTALCAILNQSLQSTGHQAVGLLGPKIYPLAGTPAMQYVTGGYLTYLYFDDPYYPNTDTYEWPQMPAGPGHSPPLDTNGAYVVGGNYDQITGLGIPNVAQIATALEGPTGGLAVTVPANFPSGPVANGSAPITLTPSVQGSATSFQWYLNNVAISGATGATLTVYPTAANEGTYSVAVGNSSGGVSALAGTLSVSTDAWIVNLSARAEVTIADPLVVGFVTTGAGSKSVLLRGDGPALAGFGVTQFLPDPQLELYAAGSNLLATLDSWSASLDSTFAQVGAFSLAPGTHDTAVLESLAPGAYTAEITSEALNYGVALAEVYDADSGAPANRLINVSARSTVSTGANILIAGFAIRGSTPETVVIRGDGPVLYSLFHLGSLQNPVLTLYDSAGGVIASNAGWGRAPTPGAAAGSVVLQPLTDAISTKIGAFSIPDGSDDSAIVATLPPGSYTAQVTSGPPFSLENFSGIALVEIYELR